MKARQLGGRYGRQLRPELPPAPGRAPSRDRSPPCARDQRHPSGEFSHRTILPMRSALVRCKSKEPARRPRGARPPPIPRRDARGHRHVERDSSVEVTSSSHRSSALASAPDSSPRSRSVVWSIMGKPRGTRTRAACLRLRDLRLALRPLQQLRRQPGPAVQADRAVARLPLRRTLVSLAGIIAKASSHGRCSPTCSSSEPAVTTLCRPLRGSQNAQNG